MIPITLVQLTEFYHGWHQKEVQAGRMAEGTLAGYRRHHLAFLKAVGDVQVKDLLPLHLMQWGTTWHKIQAVQRLFNWAVNEAGVIESNVMGKVKKPRLGERKRILKPAEQFRLLRRANKSFRALALCLRESIARPQEARALNWEDWHLFPDGGECFLLDEFKGRKRRSNPNVVRCIPISPRLSRLLARLRRRMLLPTGPIFLNTKGRPWSSNAVRCEMRELRIRVGLQPDKRGEKVVAYTWRHTSATQAWADGLRDRTLSELMGHASTRMTQRYQHPEVKPLLDAFRKSKSG